MSEKILTVTEQQAAIAELQAHKIIRGRNEYIKAAILKSLIDPESIYYKVRQKIELSLLLRKRRNILNEDERLNLEKKSKYIQADDMYVAFEFLRILLLELYDYTINIEREQVYQLSYLDDGPENETAEIETSTPEGFILKAKRGAQRLDVTSKMNLYMKDLPIDNPKLKSLFYKKSK